MIDLSTSNSDKAQIFELTQKQREWILTGYQNTTLPTNVVDYLKAKVNSSLPVTFKSTIIDDISMIRQSRTNTKKTTICRMISQLEDRLSDIDTEVLDLRLQMDAALTVFEHLRDQATKLRDERSDYEGRLIKCKALLSPFRNLPMELLIIIFRYATAGSPNIVPLQLSRVCSQWRQIVLGLPNLWNRKTQEETLSLQHTELDLLSLQVSTKHYSRQYPIKFKDIAPFHHRLSHIHLKMVLIDLCDLLFFPGAHELPLHSLAIEVKNLQAFPPDNFVYTLTCPRMSQFRIYVYGGTGTQHVDLRHLHLSALTTVELAASWLSLEVMLSRFLPPISHSFTSIRRFSLINIECNRDELVRCFTHMNVLEELILLTSAYEFLVSVLSSLLIASRPLSFPNKIANIVSLSITLVHPTIAESINIVKGLGEVIVSWMGDADRQQSLRGVSLRYLMHIYDIAGNFEADLDELRRTLKQWLHQGESESGLTILTDIQDFCTWEYDLSYWEKIT